MKKFVTLIQAIDPKDGILKTFHGDYIEAENEEEAQRMIDNSEKGYLKLDGELINEVPTEIDKLFKSFKLDLDAKE